MKIWKIGWGLPKNTKKHELHEFFHEFYEFHKLFHEFNELHIKKTWITWINL